MSTVQGSSVNFDVLKQRLRPLFSKLKVMLVDDMPANLESYRMAMVEIGIERNNIVTATNGLDALTRLNQAHPDLVLSDWNMPILDGLSFIMKARKMAHFQNKIFIMITAEQDADLEKARPHINAFLRKPATAATIEKMILSVVAKKVADPNHPLGK